MSDLKVQIADLENVQDSRKFNQWKFDTLEILEHMMPPVTEACHKVRVLKFRSYVYGGGNSGNNLDELIPNAKQILEATMATWSGQAVAE